MFYPVLWAHKQIWLHYVNRYKARCIAMQIREGEGSEQSAHPYGIKLENLKKKKSGREN